MAKEELYAALRAWGADPDVALNRLAKDDELYLACLRNFDEDKSFAGLAAALADRDYEAIFYAAHTIKGVAGNLGLNPLFEAASELVDDLRTEFYEDLDEKHDVLKGLYDEFHRMLA